MLYPFDSGTAIVFLGHPSREDVPFVLLHGRELFELSSRRQILLRVTGKRSDNPRLHGGRTKKIDRAKERLLHDKHSDAKHGCLGASGDLRTSEFDVIADDPRRDGNQHGNGESTA